MRTPYAVLALSAVALAAGGATVTSGAGIVQAAQAEAAKPDAKPTAKPDVLDTATCQVCHESQFSREFTKSYHAGVESACESCHKGAAEHSDAMQAGADNPPIPSVKKLSPREINETCLGCHEKGAQTTWKGGAHDRRNLSCTSCHAVHEYKSERHQLKTTSEPDTCFSCHGAIRAQGLRTSHHPVREGLMSCSSCHNPHDGSRPKMINAEWNNELCLQCHTEKRGPFFWEHAPVRENCTLCHNPHGSNHDKLLVSQQPWLCQRCHLNTRHPGTVYTGINSAGTSTSASNRAVEHACKNCHQNVHGGNAPTAPYLGR
jgi:DmsE family decaheme c-type cytochrome